MEYIVFEALTQQILGVLAGAFLIVYVGREKDFIRSLARVIGLVAIILCVMLFICTLLRAFDMKRSCRNDKKNHYQKLEMDVVPGGAGVVPTIIPGQVPQGSPGK